jgi:hypothetical protein
MVSSARVARASSIATSAAPQSSRNSICRRRSQSGPGRHQQVAGAALYPNLKSAETRLDKLTWLSVIESVASSLMVTPDPAGDIALVSAV